MGGFDDHVATLGDWIAPSPSPRTFFSTILDDDIDLKENTDLTDENKMGIAFTEPEEPFLLKNVDMKYGAKTGIAIDRTAESKAFTEQRVGSHVGLLERIAARAGFNAPRLITDSIKHDNLSQNPEVRSPYLTIPPGLSPTTLLDSPVFLSDAQIQASPTTGKFQSALSGNNRSSLLATGAHDKRIEGIPASSFALKRVVESSPPFFHTAENKVTQPMLCRSSFSHNVKASNQLESSVLPRSMEPSKGPLQNETALWHVQDNFSKVSSGRDTGDKTLISESGIFDAVGGSGEYSPPLDVQQEEDVDQRGSGDACAGGVLSEDAYNWRKYGQKQVKGSEYPRSYYKCTHPNCPVKKKVERSHEGHTTEIIYKGAHNHPKPPPNRRSALTSLIGPTDIHIDSTDQVGPDAEVDPLWTAMQRGISTGGPDWGYDNLEVKSLVSLGGEYCDASTSVRDQNGSQFEAGDAIDGSPTFSNDEDEHGTNGSASLGYNGEGYESESKRRKLEAYSTEMSGATRAIREPRVVVQTTSDVDILDDGYRWRKYGQKVVKGNPNPRSYYKCTSAGCTVRKHVERASHDLKSVITTYEGKHNHEVPAARNSSHTNSSLHNSLAAQTSVVWRHVHGPEPSLIHSSMSRYEMPPPLTSFGLLARDQLAPSQGFAFRTNPPELTNLAMAGLGPNHNKLPILPAHSYMGQPRPLNNMGFMLPKGEPKVEPMSEHNVNIPIGSSVYHQMMSRLPLGPQM